MAIPNMLSEVERAKRDFPQAWADAHTGNAHTEDFIRLLATRLHRLNPSFGLNGKRGDPNDLSDDALNFVGEGGGITPDGRPCSVIDAIGAAGSPQARPQWVVFSRPPEANGAWVSPGSAPTPEPVPEPEPPHECPEPEPEPITPYPGDPVWDAVGVILFEDYAAANQSPNPQMGRWFGRTIWDATEGDESGAVLTVEASIRKHRNEWRAVLGLPPL